jgi:mono/diheme cytochrome c family protein
VRRLWVVLSLVAAVAAAGLLSGCVTSSEEAAQTPTGSPTVVNSAIQTDSNGKTVTAPAATAPAAGGGGAATAPAAGGAAGDVAAGLVVFQAKCTGCHLSDGTAAGGVGPQLKGMGLSAETIKNQVVNGGGAMPAGLATGTDLDNVVAYVVSIQ